MQHYQSQCSTALSLQWHVSYTPTHTRIHTSVGSIGVSFVCVVSVRCSAAAEQEVEGRGTFHWPRCFHKTGDSVNQSKSGIESLFNGFNEWRKLALLWKTNTFAPLWSALRGLCPCLPNTDISNIDMSYFI